MIWYTKEQELICKRQKLIRIADKSVDRWKVVDEYISDEMASDLEDEKRRRLRRQQAGKGDSLGKVVVDQNWKRFKGLSTDQQLFRG